MNDILIIDDDDQLRQSFVKLLHEEGYRVAAAPSAEAGIRLLRESEPELVIIDVRLPGMSGLDAFKTIQRLKPKLPVIIMTAYGNTETAIEATKMGAYDYVLKPFDIPVMLGMIQEAINAGRFMRNPVALNELPEEINRDAMIGSSMMMQNVYKAIGRVAATDATVLIRGDSGTGKELVARAIYQHSMRSEKPFLVINCVAIPETLLESELFGYEKGAFTGAVHRRIGKIEQANGGTVFLDEIGDMPLALQAKILRVLQEKRIERLGGRETIPVHVRIIADTNRNLEEMIALSQFREDLYYRLKVITIWLPPLKERNGDIHQLIDYFMERFARELGVPNPGITQYARELLQAMPWPGNVRELANTLQKALIFNRGAPLDANDISSAIAENETELQEKQIEMKEMLRNWVRQMLQENGHEALFEESMDHFAAILIEEALNLTGGNRSRAARLLGLSRPTLHAKIDKYQLTFKTSVKSNTY